MKRFLLACFLLTATCSFISVQHASAQAVTQASFITKVDSMDAQLGAGNLTAAQATWTSIHTDMLAVLGVTKASMASAATPAIYSSYDAIRLNQRTLYFTIWGLHTDLATNRAALKTNLTSFDATIY